MDLVNPSVDIHNLLTATSSAEFIGNGEESKSKLPLRWVISSLVVIIVVESLWSSDWRREYFSPGHLSDTTGIAQDCMLSVVSHSVVFISWCHLKLGIRCSDPLLNHK